MVCSAFGCEDAVYTTFLGFAACELHYLELVYIAQSFSPYYSNWHANVMHDAAQKMLRAGIDAPMPIEHLREMTAPREVPDA